MQELPFSIFPIDSKPHGLSYGEWSERWWKWLLSIPKTKSPAFDFDGQNANTNQDDRSVFFLCQTIETPKIMPTRDVNVPYGKNIFVPLMNWISALHENGETDEELINSAKVRMDAVDSLLISVNGIKLNEELKKFRAQSRVFDFILPEDNILDHPPGHTRLFSDGYWLFLSPTQNLNQLETFGTCTSGVNKISVNYKLRIMR